MLRWLRILTVYSETQCKALPRTLRTVKKNVKSRGSLVAECMLHLRFIHKCVLELYAWKSVHASFIAPMSSTTAPSTEQEFILSVVGTSRAPPRQ